LDGLRCDWATKLAAVEGDPSDAAAIVQFTFFSTSDVRLLSSIATTLHMELAKQCLCCSVSVCHQLSASVYLQGRVRVRKLL
jgi:hypothetical protein